MKKIIVSVFFMLLVGCSNEASNKVTGFDRVCNAFEALSKNRKLNELSAGDRDLFIFHEIRDLDANGNAKQGWVHARYVVPVEERYTLYKDIVDSIEHGDWSCLAMKELAPTLNIAYVEENPNDIDLPEPVSLENADF